MFDRKIITPALVLFILLLLGCVFYAQFSNEDVADQSSEDLESDTIYVLNESSSSPQAQDYTLWHGLWDSWNYNGDEFNTGKVPNPSKANEVLNSGKNVFVSMSHRWKRNGEKLSRDQWKTILRGFTSVITDLDPQRTIVLLQDEPLTNHHGFILEEVEFLAHWAKEYWGEDTQIGFTFTRGTILRRELPQNIDFAILPMYLFFREDYPDVQVWSEQEFHDEFDRLIQNARHKLQEGVDLFVIGQGFYNPDHVEDRRRKWRQPPLHAPGWYAEAIQRNNVKGLFWWVYHTDRNDTVGLEDMPAYFDEIRNLHQ